LYRAFLLSVSATFTRVLPTHLTHRQEIEAYMEQQETAADTLQEHRRLILSIKPRSPSYAHAYWAAGPRLKRMATQRRRHRLHCHASAYRYCR
jgi:hypothetical protein